MKSVGLRELKNRLSEYVRQVRGGEEVLVTDRGEVVAALVPPGHGMAGLASGMSPGLAALARAGSVILGAPNDPALYPDLPSVLKRYTSQQLLDEDRGTR